MITPLQKQHTHRQENARQRQNNLGNDRKQIYNIASQHANRASRKSEQKNNQRKNPRK